MQILNPQKRTAIRPATGTMLIAEPFLTDPGFARTVILICDHSEEGTIGFIINRLSLNSVSELLPGLHAPAVNVHEGGPVQPDTLHILHDHPDELGGEQVLPGVYWGCSYENLARLIESNEAAPQNLRLLVGYAGWEQGQLDRELEEGSWIVAPGKQAIIFDEDSTEIWKRALTSLGKDFAYLANFPLHPQFN